MGWGSAMLLRLREGQAFQPILLQPGDPVVFPDPSEADAEGLVAVGGELSIERLRFAYEHGIFPWSDDDNPPLWWSPDPRCVIPLDGVHVPRRLRKRMRRGGFELTTDVAFERVMRRCAEARSDGTWITEEMVGAYVALHAQGLASSVEVWASEELVGGLYGVRVGGLFAAESMFKSRTDMSKVALVTALEAARAAGFSLFDVQFKTDHLAQFGAVELSRARYLAELERARGASAGPLRVDA